MHWELTASTQSLKSRCVTFSKHRRECLTTIFRLSQRKRSGYASQANSLHTLHLCAPVNWRTTGEDDDVTFYESVANGDRKRAFQTVDTVKLLNQLPLMHAVHLPLH